MSSVVYAVLNDLSLHTPPQYPVAGTKYQAREWVTSFYRLFTQAQEAGVNGLRTYVPYAQMQLVEGYSLHDWSVDTDVEEDLRKRIKDIFSQLSHIEDLSIECKYRERIANGIWGAMYLKSLSISLLTDAIWDTHELIVDILELDEAGEFKQPRQETIRHLAQLTHLATHREWLTSQTAIPIPNGQSLWMALKRRCPSLSFCKNTKKQIKQLEGERLKQVINRLDELETACKNWKSGNFDLETLSHCTPESKRTLSQYAAEHTFLCEDGESRLFSLHTRFTPGAGRIFFVPHTKDTGENVFFIGHVGDKLPTVNDPT